MALSIALTWRLQPTGKSDKILHHNLKNEMQSGKTIYTKKTFAEFFAGIGLMRIALEREGWQIAFANDIDPDKAEIYLANFSDAEQHFLLGDIHHIPPSDVPTVDLATASFPCNDLSLAGAREGLQGENSSAFW